MKNKKGMSKWFWILIILAIVGMGIYFLLYNSVPQPPALPN